MKNKIINALLFLFIALLLSLLTVSVYNLANKLFAYSNTETPPLNSCWMMLDEDKCTGDKSKYTQSDKNVTAGYFGVVIEPGQLAVSAYWVKLTCCNYKELLLGNNLGDASTHFGDIDNSDLHWVYKQVSCSGLGDVMIKEVENRIRSPTEE